jgi:pimeloyl-ACP methyl ester carboxylesterase
MSTTLVARAAFVPGLVLALASATAAGADERDPKGQKILSIDHAVPHVSTVPANAGEEVVLFVRERVRADKSENGNKRNGRNEIVLFLHGGTVPSVPDYDLHFEDYNWAEYLVEHGFDVFMMDQSGYGFSPRPEMDDPCNVNPDDQELLVPNPLEAPCDPSYPFNLTTRQSDWDEIDSVVNYILELRGEQRIDLAGWSGGVPRIGGYAVLHPEKVDELYFYAGAASETEPLDPPAEVPAPGFPMSLQTHDELMNDRWGSEVGCEDQFDPDIQPVIWNTIMTFDPLGSTWGSPPWNPVASPEGGVMRTRTATNWGWNADVAGMVQAPSLVIVGEFDGAREPSRQLYEALGTKHKVLIEVACASHFLVWENQHEILLTTSEEWLRKGSIDGHRTGTFWVDESGRLQAQ